jgi:hypothetical protein
MDIITKLRSCQTDKDNFPRMRSERYLSVGDALDAANKIESDAKAIAARDAKIVELEAGYEIQMRNLDAAEKVIAALREALNLFVVHSTYPVSTEINRRGYSWRDERALDYAFDEAIKALGAIEHTAGE